VTPYRAGRIQLYKVSKGLREIYLGMTVGRGNVERSNTHQVVIEICGRGKFLPNRATTTWNLLLPFVVNGYSNNDFEDET
jgi:hypothetical protein